MHLLRWEFMDEDDTFKIHLEQHTTVTDYAILSHRWGKPEDEVSFDDMIAGTHESKKGHENLSAVVDKPEIDGIRHVWVDTCCINKASSAELSDPITSMFAYYNQSRVCYAFLNDVASFSQSVWSIRGWTLQELIALQQVRFFDSRWSLIGCKTDDDHVSITNIDPILLRVPTTTKVISISKKMSWAAQRETTRKKDMAYCFMEIFRVFVSPLYGEGAHAFTNSGLSILLPLSMINESNGLYLAFLACTEGKQPVPSAIFLKTSKGTPTGVSSIKDAASSARDSASGIVSSAKGAASSAAGKASSVVESVRGSISSAVESKTGNAASTATSTEASTSEHINTAAAASISSNIARISSDIQTAKGAVSSSLHSALESASSALASAKASATASATTSTSTSKAAGAMTTAAVAIGALMGGAAVLVNM
ncbi:Vegetative incompatibility protein HET-E-1 [Fusarium odoratissimum]|uniref:Vegetative incompatibility protein HET-E-1 n=1 Tax=Fusarium oxysporum f. sp. cubense (strain race 4) TaxID=2502994 RepID=N1RL62_FUSC4|nr:Vegetative incompatibility protein HET-E-1 [Fusarium odoratissimum]